MSSSSSADITARAPVLPEPRPAAADAARADDIVEHTRNELGVWERVSFDIVHACMAWMVRRVGPARVYRFGSAFATLEWLINHRRRRRFAEALHTLLGEEVASPRLRRECREFFRAGRCNKLFYLIFDALTRQQAEGLVRVERRELADAALARGRGVYVAMSHHGPYQIGGMFMSLLGYRMAAVRDRNEGALSRYVQQRVDRCCPDLARMKVFFSDAYPRVIYRCLKEGYMLGSAMDVSRMKRANLRTATVNVFGRPRELLSGPLHIAIRCAVPVLQAFVLPEADFRYRIRFYGPLYDPEAGLSEDEAMRIALEAYARNMEAHIRAHPSLITRI